MKHRSCSRNQRNLSRALGPVVAVIATAGFVGGASARTFDSGNRDVGIRWDNTVRYTAGWRMQNPDSRIVSHPASDESDSKFDKHDMVANRFDLLSELDVVYKKKHGFRISGQAWYDDAYSDTTVRQNPALAAAGVPSSYVNNQYSAFTKRWYKGLSGEILDAFVFGGTDIGGVPVNAKLGRHTLYWGQALFYMGGISYSQAGLDLRKGVANPGSEVKELFMPVNQFSFQAQLTSRVSLAGQYFFDWDYYRAPEGGTYLSAVDFIMDGPARTGASATAIGFLPRGDAVVPDKKRGNWGLNLKWQPDFLAGGSLAATYRELDEKSSWLLMSPALTSYRAVFPRDTKIFGLSIDTTVGQASVAGEIAYRKNAGLKTPSLAVASEGARGNVLHAALNAVYLLPSTSFWSNGSVAMEVYGSRLQKITKNESLFQGVGYAACRNPLTGIAASGDRFDGCATKSNWGMSVSFAPQWQDLFPSVDVTMPISASYHVRGNQSDLTSGNEGSYTYGVGVEADIYRQYKVNLSYRGYGGKISRLGPTGAYASTNGGTALLGDRNWLSLTLKTSF